MNNKLLGAILLGSAGLTAAIGRLVHRSLTPSSLVVSLPEP